jgi:hypothetical protein
MKRYNIGIFEDDELKAYHCYVNYDKKILDCLPIEMVGIPIEQKSYAMCLNGKENAQWMLNFLTERNLPVVPVNGTDRYNIPEIKNPELRLLEVVK